jgi:hypothetical protein
VSIGTNLVGGTSYWEVSNPLDRSLENQRAVARLAGMVRSPRATLAGVIASPRSLDLAILIVAVSVACSVTFLMTRVGRLAALDQQVRQLESVGTIVTDTLYAKLRGWERYRPLLSAVGIAVGWPVTWACTAALLRAIGNRVSPVKATFPQVLTVIVHGSSVFAVRAVVATPLNYMRESLGGATSVAMLLPGLGDATFAARLLGAIDVFAVWWVLLVALGLGMVYHTRGVSIAGWLIGAYATGAAALTLTQALLGGL